MEKISDQWLIDKIDPTKLDGLPQETSTADNINCPAHYTKGIECFDYVVSHNMDFPQGNVIKYVTRFRHKGTPLEDLKKAEWYLKRLIAIEESRGG